ncbi:MAG TPA: hypothetical protein VFR24_23585 [Candidatus Angelobacter sp.]|nr:hypothetical protein [Candidatus Angelobacter sp.]
MATSKAKHLIDLTQLTPKHQRHRTTPQPNSKAGTADKPEAAGLMPVKAHIYHSIAELNSGFEQVVRELQTLGGLNLFRASDVAAMRETICRMRAQANRDFALAIHDREKVNADVLRS